MGAVSSPPFQRDPSMRNPSAVTTEKGSALGAGCLGRGVRAGAALTDGATETAARVAEDTGLVLDESLQVQPPKEAPTNIIPRHMGKKRGMTTGG